MIFTIIQDSAQEHKKSRTLHQVWNVGIYVVVEFCGVQIVPIGRSLGGAVAIHLAAQGPKHDIHKITRFKTRVLEHKNNTFQGWCIRFGMCAVMASWGFVV